MVGNELELDIISVFSKDLAGLYSIHQISNKLHKAYPYIHKKVNDLIDEQVLDKVIMGRSYLCSINLDSEKAIFLLGLEMMRRKNPSLLKLKSTIKGIARSYRIETAFFFKGRAYIILEHIYDKDSITKNFTIEAEFLTAAQMQDLLLSKLSAVDDITVLYAYERFFEQVNHIKDRLLSQRLFRK